MFFKPTRLSAFLVLFYGLGNQVQAQVNLVTASSFGVVASSAITNTGPTVIDGQIGISPADASSVTGFPPGTAFASVDVSSRAQQDAQVAYNAARSLAPTRDITGQDLGGQLLVPGTYFASSSVGITGTLTLDGQNNPNAQFVFQIGSTLTTATSSAVIFINGARACNVFWQIGSSATLGTGTTFTGNIIAQASITLTTGTTVNGGLYALTGAVTLDTNRIIAPQRCPRQPTGTTSLSAATTSLMFSLVSVSGPVVTTLADTTTNLPSQQGASSGGLNRNVNSDGGATIPGSGISTTELGNSIRVSLPSNTIISTGNSERIAATTLSRDATTTAISESTQASASMETSFSSMRSNVYSTTKNTRSIRSTATYSRSNMVTLSLNTETSKSQPTTRPTEKTLKSESSEVLRSTMSTTKQGSKSGYRSSTTSLKTSSTNSTYLKFRTTTAPAPSNFATTVLTEDQITTTASNDKITTINGTPCTTISYYEPTCSCTTTTVVPFAFTPTPSPEVSVITVNGVPCTTTRYYESACDCIRTSNVPLQVITASASVATVVNGVPCVTSKYYESACDCVRVATVPVQIMSTVPKPGEVQGVATTACAQTGQILFACMSACMEPYMPIATETVTASGTCSAIPRYRM